MLQILPMVMGGGSMMSGVMGGGMNAIQSLMRGCRNFAQGGPLGFLMNKMLRQGGSGFGGGFGGGFGSNNGLQGAMQNILGRGKGGFGQFGQGYPTASIQAQNTMLGGQLNTAQAAGALAQYGKAVGIGAMTSDTLEAIAKNGGNGGAAIAAQYFLNNRKEWAAVETYDCGGRDDLAGTDSAIGGYARAHGVQV